MKMLLLSVACCALSLAYATPRPEAGERQDSAAGAAVGAAAGALFKSLTK